MNTDLWETVMDKAKGQQAKGLKKYGKPVTADEAVDWLEHAIEEQLDSAVYLEAAKSVISGLQQSVRDLNGELTLLTERNLALLTECGEWEKLVATADQTAAGTIQETTLLKRKIAELEEDYQGQCEVAEQRWELLQAEEKTVAVLRGEKQVLHGKIKIAQQAKERAEADTAAVLRRLKEYHQSEGTLALVAAMVAATVGVLLGYFLF